MSFNALTAVSAVRNAVSVVVGIGTGKIVGQIIKNNITPETLRDKVTVTAASWAIGAMVGSATKKFTEKEFDTAVEQGTKLFNKFKQSSKLARVNTGQSTFEEEGLNPSEFEKNKEGKWVRSEVVDAEIVEEPVNS